MHFEVYGTVLIMIIENVVEGFVDCYLLVSNWGKPSLFTDPFSAASIMNDLLPLRSALREYHISKDILSCEAPSRSAGIIVQSFFTWRIWTFSMAIYRQEAVRFLIAAICLSIILVSVRPCLRPDDFEHARALAY